MVKIPPPFFVIRNSRHSPNGNGGEASVASVNRDGRVGGGESNEDSASIDEFDEDENHNNDLPSSIPIVYLVEAPRGMYMLDFCHANESFMADFLADNEITKSDGASGDRTFIDGAAWNYLERTANYWASLSRRAMRKL